VGVGAVGGRTAGGVVGGPVSHWSGCVWCSWLLCEEEELDFEEDSLSLSGTYVGGRGGWDLRAVQLGRWCSFA
jgi:hypothetical protein